ncbi:penicillin-binding protein activator [Aurantiacibacter spongiae]|uniref:Penicillin-binding protein activator n=1 Tax=Aurantiacibacter spongiae TaxID=2488860 RepID=A0A3N5CSK7_9SPHN|nr:penicillin-binding protein activator [Aurantiacibacter spongiae]RPF70300.1 penicillin-binding protein activator [Aurantiacibacter spongiae]
MFGKFWRLCTAGMAATVLAGCAIIPGGDDYRPDAGPVVQQSAPRQAGRLQSNGQHLVAILVPLSGENGDVGQSIANAANMALLDTGAENLRLTTYDTSGGAGAAASAAIRDGNRLILGPLRRDNVGAVLAQARPAGVPLITFSNDTTVARDDVFVMGHVPEQSVARSARFAIDQGAQNFAVLAPRGDYGQKALVSLENTVRSNGGNVVAVERYDRGNTSILSAADRLNTAGGFDTVLIADGADLAERAASRLKRAGQRLPSVIGTELWSGEGSLTEDAALRGAWFSAVSDDRWRQFAESYRQRYDARPYRIATLGYDAVLLTLRLARDWQVGDDLPTRLLTAQDGFLGLDGAIRFMPDGVGERAMEVRQVGNGTFTVVDPAPTQF